MEASPLSVWSHGSTGQRCAQQRPSRWPQVARAPSPGAQPRCWPRHAPGWGGGWSVTSEGLPRRPANPCKYLEDKFKREQADILPHLGGGRLSRAWRDLRSREGLGMEAGSRLPLPSERFLPRPSDTKHGPKVLVVITTRRVWAAPDGTSWAKTAFGGVHTGL